MDRNRNHPLRAARVQRNLSIQDVADETHLSIRTILRAEQGYRLRPESRRILCDYFEKSSYELGLLSSDGNAERRKEQVEETRQVIPFVPGNVGEQHNHLDLLSQPGLLREVEKCMAHLDPSRRALLQQLLGAVSLALPLFSSHELLSPELGERLSRAIQEPAALNEATLSHYEQLTSLCWHLSDENGLGLVEQLIPSYLPHITTLAQEKSKYQTRIANIAAQSYLLGYVTALHRENFHLALSYCQHARRYGQLARDPNLEVIALLRQGNIYLYLRSPWKVLESYQEAFPKIKAVSPLLRARTYAVMAEIQGKLGREHDVQVSMGSAYDSFPTNERADPSSQYIHFSQSGLYLHEGLAFLNLHKGLLAAKAFEHVDGLQPKLPISERSRIDILIQQSWAAAQLRDLDQYILYLEAAITSAHKLGSDLLLSEAWDCYTRQSQWSAEPDFKRMAERFRQIK